MMDCAGRYLPVTFKHEQPQRSSASDTGPAMVGGAERSIAGGIQAEVDRTSAEAGSSFTQGTFSRWAAETRNIGKFAKRGTGQGEGSNQAGIKESAWLRELAPR